MVRKNDVRMVWLCWFWGSMNGWDLKILYRDLESWKKWLKKNGMELNSLKDLKSWKKWKKWNGMGEMDLSKQMVNVTEHTARMSCPGSLACQAITSGNNGVSKSPLRISITRWTTHSGHSLAYSFVYKPLNWYRLSSKSRENLQNH